MEESRAWFDKGVQWMEKYRPRDCELCSYRAEAAEVLGIIGGTTNSSPSPNVSPHARRAEDQRQGPHP